MRAKSKRGKQGEQGVALLIAIFALMLISVVAIALVVSSGTDSALAGNYRTATGAYYASVAGLEEARGRLLFKNPDFINKANSLSSLFDSSGILPQWGLGQVVYITNPATGEVVDPTNLSGPYPDNEYQKEFGVSITGAAVYQIPSVSPISSLSLPGPSYKWVRVNAVTENALNIDVNGDGIKDNAVALYYDAAHLSPTNAPAPSLVVPSVPGVPPTPTSVQALEITGLAVLPGGGTRLLQYVVAPVVISPVAGALGFPAALTLFGNNVSYTGPETNSFYIRGQDQCAGSSVAVPSIGFVLTGAGGSSVTEQNNISGQEEPASNYPGAPLTGSPASTPTTPSIADVTAQVRQSWMSVSSLEALAQTITANADAVVTGPASGSSLPSGMSSLNPMTVVVNGDLNLNSWHNTGYGLLLVTGTLYYDPDASWEGIILLIGQGSWVSTKGGSGQINGAVLLAKTRDPSGNLLSTLGSASFSQTSSGNPNTNYGQGINYNSCWLSGATGAQGPISYKVLSFREIPLS